MQNNFEKQVREKMEELHLTPSEPVWNSIYRQIKEKKERRRVLFFWLPLLGLLLAGGLWWGIASHGETKLAANTESISLPPVQTAVPATTPVPGTDVNAQKEKQNEGTGLLSNKEQGTTIRGEGNRVLQNGAFSIPSGTSGKPSKVNAKTGSTSIAGSKAAGFTKNGSKKIKITTAGVADTNSNAALNGKNPQSPTQKDTEGTTINEQTAVVEKTQPAAITTNPAPDSAAVTTLAKKEDKLKNNKWKWSLNFQEGYSSYHSTLFNSGTVANAFSNSLAPIQVPNRPVTQTISSGFSFAIGGDIRRLIGKRLEISAGIQYHYYSAYIKVGQKENIVTSAAYRADSLRVSGIYDNSNKRNFTNKFHVIEFPVSVSYQLFQKIPMFVMAGASYGRLISTNALTYDHDNNFYYYNEDNYRRNYLNGFGGLQFRLINNKKLSLETGPIVQYNVTRLQRENRYTIPHLFYAGIKTSISF